MIAELSSVMDLKVNVAHGCPESALCGIVTSGALWYLSLYASIHIHVYALYVCVEKNSLSLPIASQSGPQVNPPKLP